jgi:hypothetical protein
VARTAITLYRTQFAPQAALRPVLEEGSISCANAGNYTTITTGNADDEPTWSLTRW